jgi:Early transcription elongation factor of RNA pol II, NGN section
VKDGCKYDVVLAILQQSLDLHSEHKILSAFAWSLIKGSVYIEASSPLAVINVLHGISGVMWSQVTIWLSLVSLEDCIPLLEMADVPSLIRAGSWVKIQWRGTYCRDAAIVLEVKEHTVVVTLVSRIHLILKHKCGWHGCPEPGLFNLQLVTDLFGSKLLTQIDSGWKFKDKIYKRGLMVKEYSLYDVTDQGVVISPSTIRVFQQSQYTQIVEILNVMSARLEVDDRVHIVTGTFRGLVRHVVDVHEDKTIRFSYDNLPSYGIVTVSYWEVQRIFQLGDHYYGLSTRAYKLRILRR